MNYKTGLMAATVLLAGCQTLDLSSVPGVKQAPPPVDPYQQVLSSDGFELSLKTPGPENVESLRVYMDAAPATAAPLAWRLHKQDHGSFYARFPCMKMAESNQCNSRYRADQQYATEQAQAVASMFSRLKRERGATVLEVVATGDAAPLMLKVAALSGDIDHLQTLDGKLSPAIWARQHGMAAPTTSDPLIYYRQLAKQPQTHWISAAGGIDQEYLAGRYKSALKQSNCVRLRIASTVMKETDWLSVWPVVKGGRFSCRG